MAVGSVVSRRRHTRSYGDWSSDVCSSDLTEPHYQITQFRIDSVSQRGEWPTENSNRMRTTSLAVLTAVVAILSATFVQDNIVFGACLAHARSEERRVGKECRWRWGA